MQVNLNSNKQLNPNFKVYFFNDTFVTKESYNEN